MRRSADDALLALRDQLRHWATGSRANEIRVLVYPPEREGEMLRRIPLAVQELAGEGIVCEVVDLGSALATELRLRNDRLKRFIEMEASSPERTLADLGVIGTRMVTRLLRAPLPAGAVCRLLLNIGPLAVHVSFSAITNELFGSTDQPTPPTIIAFPGEADERSLNLLGLREDTNYRVPRI